MFREARIDSYPTTMSSLVKSAREFWFNNEPGEFWLGQRAITKDEIFTYGGPNPEFNSCHVCQEQEWLSRVEQKNLFREHECAVLTNDKKYCKFVCERQGDDNWTNYHQNFLFAVGCDKKLQAPRCLLYLFDETAASVYARFVNNSCDQWIINLRRQLAYTCQLEVVQDLSGGVHRTLHDLVFLFNSGSTVPRFLHAQAPLIMIGNDPITGCAQAVKDLKPEYHFGTTSSIWEELPEDVNFRFYPLLAGSFFTRPNLDPEKKKYDLVVAGITAEEGTYRRRWLLRKQIEQLKGFSYDFAAWAGYFRATHYGPTHSKYQDRDTLYLNAWSERLGAGRFVTFGGACDYLLYKYGECLGSGAVPILPYCPDLERLGVEPMVHYIPQEGIIDNNERLKHCLENYEKYKYIAENAVQWHQENADKMLFQGFENVIREVTGYRFPKRVAI